MSIKKLFKAVLTPSDLCGTYFLFRKLGASRIQALKSAVDCVVLYRFVLA